MNLRTLLYSFFGLLGVFLTLFFWSTYRYYETVHADDPVQPELFVTTGVSKIIRGPVTYELSEKEEYTLEDSDIIETGMDSNATITWPDKSLTRLGPKTRITIEKMYASSNYDNIQIAYSLEQGKVWNTIIRSLVGDSYFEVHLPRESIVAGVRGTTFEVNLENHYIRAISHNTLLTQKKQSVELFPGEMVDSENILILKGKEWLDKTWNDWNTSADFIYEGLRKIEIEKRIEDLTRDIGNMSLSNLSRNILEKVPGFEEISIAEYLKNNELTELKNISSESLLSYYQKLGNISNADSRERIRSALLESRNGAIAKFRNSLEMHAFLESLDSGVITLSANKYLEGKGINTEEFASKFMSGAKNDINTFRGVLSGSFNTILGK